VKTYTEPQRETVVFGEYDVIVAGGGPAGVGACISAARAGAKTIVVEQMGALGGVGTTGLHTHMNQLNAAGSPEMIVGGIPMELSRRIVDRGAGVLRNGMLDYDVEEMKIEYDNMVTDAGADVLYHTLVAGAIVEDETIKGVLVESKSGRWAILGKTVVDCTADADVAARTGVPCEKGRPKDGLMQPVTLMFRMAGVDWEKLAEYRKSDPKIKDMCQRAIDAGDMEPFQTQLMGFWHWPGRPDEVGVNFTHMIRIDCTNVQDMTHAETEGRRQCKMALGAFRKHLPGCENAYMVDTAAIVGTRESRRIVGEYVLTKDDVLRVRTFEDAIAKGSFFVDIHNLTGPGMDKASGEHLKKGDSYDIPYRCLVPKGVDNLLVAGRSISATHEAQGSIRVMFQCMAMGEAAGLAAALCAESGVTPRALDVQELRQRLVDQGAIV